MSVCCECCVLLGRGVCIGLITRPDEYYRICVFVCVIEEDHTGGLHDGGMVCLSVIVKPRY